MWKLIMTEKLLLSQAEKCLFGHIVAWMVYFVKPLCSWKACLHQKFLFHYLWFFHKPFPIFGQIFGQKVQGMPWLLLLRLSSSFSFPPLKIRWFSPSFLHQPGPIPSFLLQGHGSRCCTRATAMLVWPHWICRANQKVNGGVQLSPGTLSAWNNGNNFSFPFPQHATLWGRLEPSLSRRLLES